MLMCMAKDTIEYINETFKLNVKNSTFKMKLNGPPLSSSDKLLAPINRLTRLLWYMGLWPSVLSDKPKPSCISWMAYTLYTIVFHTIFTFAYVAFKCINFISITDLTIITRALFITLTELSLTVKIVNFYIRFSTMKRCLQTVREIQLIDDEEEAIFVTRLGFLNKIILAFLITANMTGLFSYLSPVLVSEPMLPYPGWYPLDWMNSHRDYWIVYAYQVLGMFFQIQTLVILEIYFIYLMVIVSTQMELLARRLNRIGYGVGEQKGGSHFEYNFIQNELAERTLKDCIIVHCDILKYAAINEWQH